MVSIKMIKELAGVQMLTRVSGKLRNDRRRDGQPE